MAHQIDQWLPGAGMLVRILFIIMVLLALHMSVSLIRRLGQRMTSFVPGRRLAKLRTIASLVTSLIVFSLYFIGLGMIIKEFGLSLRTYLASASIMGLALGFGSQGLVQDVVTGLTLVFSDLFDVGEMVEISGQVGIVRSVGMRFTVLENSLGAMVYIPNRTIANVLNYPRGYVRALLDVTLPPGPEAAQAAQKQVVMITKACHEQMPGIFVTPPTVEGLIQTSMGKTLLRTKMRIWPGRGGVLETTLKAEIVQAMRMLDDQYADWMVSVNYEAEKKAELPLRRK